MFKLMSEHFQAQLQFKPRSPPDCLRQKLDPPDDVPKNLAERAENFFFARTKELGLSFFEVHPRTSFSRPH